MRKVINDLIQRYFELGLITTMLVPIKTGSGQGFVYKEVRARTSLAWEMKDMQTGEYSDKMAVDLIELEKDNLANELFEMTKALIQAEGLTDEHIPGSTKAYLSEEDEVKADKKTGNMGHRDKMMWCIVRLRAMKVISPFIRQYLQPVDDNDGNMIGNKIVPEDQLDKMELEEAESNG